MLRQSDIAAAFRESVLRNAKGYQYLYTRDFVTALRRRGIHFPRWRLTPGSLASSLTTSIKRQSIVKTACG